MHFRIHHHRRLAAPLLACAVMVGGAGCASLKPEPWLSPYERNYLADPIMSFDRAPAAQGFMIHVHQVREGARGGEGGSGGGCGCN